MENKKNHLPILGIGPILCFPMAIIAAVAIIMSVKGFIPFTIENKFVKCIFIVLGIVFIIEGLLCFFGADFGGSSHDVILLPAMIALTKKLIPKSVWESSLNKAEDMWKDGKPRRWYYAIPVIVIWLLVILFILRKCD